MTNVYEITKVGNDDGILKQKLLFRGLNSGGGFP